MVKLLTLLFALYILLLPCIPCTDQVDCGGIAQTEMQSQPGNAQDHRHENEACNPFCNCACCGQNLDPQVQFCKTIALQSSSIQKQENLYSNISLPSDFFGNIWQPPKLI